MILQEEKIDVKTSQQFESKQMSISPEFFNKMIWHVILQYKYKIRTSVQELISNAIDAQVEAGNTDTPLKMQLPTRLEPTFKLRDYGTGMTPEVMDKIYRNMGASGSSHTNNKKGGFGIGGKSPLGFSDQYNIKTYVDGQFWFYVVYKNKENGINVDLLQTGDTDEPNGTEIQIPAKSDQIRKFTEAACRATMFWDNQPLFNLEQENLYTAKNENKISNNVSLFEHKDLGNLFKDNWNAEIVLIVDGIPYIIDNEIVRKVKPLKTLKDMLKDESVLTIKVNNGDVKILQTRESLEDCDYTINQLQIFGDQALKDVTKYIENQTKKANVLDTANALVELGSQFNNIPGIEMNGFKIKGRHISLVCQSKIGLIEYHHRSKRYGQKLEKAKRNTELKDWFYIDELEKIYFDDLLDSESSILKSRRIKYSIADNKDNAFYIDTETTDDKIIDLLKANFTLEPISSLPLPPKEAKVTYSSAKILDKGEIDVHTLGKSTRWDARYYDIVRTVETIDLNTTKTKFIWADYFDYDQNIKTPTWVNFMKSLGFTPCLISKKYQDKIEGDKRFISFNKWVDDFKLKDSQINGIIFNELGLNDRDILLAKASLLGKDKKLKQYGETLVFNMDRVRDLPHELKDRVVKDNKTKIQNIKKDKDFFYRTIKAKYNLLTKVTSLTAKEATDYINLAYRR